MDKLTTTQDNETFTENAADQNTALNPPVNCQASDNWQPFSVSNTLDLRSSLERNVVLVGLGPHAKRIYIHNFQKYNFLPRLIIDLESNKDEIKEYLRNQGFPVDTFFIPDEYRDHEVIPEPYRSQLLAEVQRLEITHDIISTEPKAHFAYLCFFLENGIHTLCDKPITAPRYVSTQSRMAQKIRDDYEYLRNIYLITKAKNEVTCVVQCQRRWHAGYAYIRELLTECIDQYQIPITSIEIYHCDGMWNMPNEYLSRENHPYKYGYGKLFHSGYHFIDLMCWLEKLNSRLEHKRPNQVEMYTTITRPSDLLHVFDEQSYRLIFRTDKFEDIFKNSPAYHFEDFGEVDFYGLIQFKQNNNVISTCSLNLLQNGFSRRNWVDLPKDTYKSNGRVRHERVNIQVGPLMNVQVHSYQSKEIKDRSDDYDVGSVEHFDIYIFRNEGIIGGQPFEKISLQSLASFERKPSFIGFNEHAREQCVADFLSNEKESISDLLDHDLTVTILSSAYQSICRRRMGSSPIVKFSV